MAAAVDAGASYLGFNFFPPSPRYLSLADARWVVPSVPEGVVRVALTVDAPDELLEALLGAVRIDMLQLHGRESPERVAEVRARFDRPVMKALGIAGEADLAKIDAYAAVADQVMIEAAPPRDATRPGGNGLAFDWQLIRGRRWNAAVDAGRRTDARERGRGDPADRRGAGRRRLRGGEPAGVQGRGQGGGLRPQRPRGGAARRLRALDGRRARG